MRVQYYGLALFLLSMTVMVPIARAQSGALVFGSDAVGSPPPVTLPTANNYWFTQGNGTSIQGTQVPDYWVNKIGGELDAMIEHCATASMTTRNQMLACVQSMISGALAPLAQIAPLKTGVLGASIGTGYSNTISLGFTAPAAGYIVARGWSNPSLIQAGPVHLSLSDSVDGTFAADSTVMSQNHEIIVPVTSGESGTVSLAVSAVGTFSTASQVSYYLAYSFIPAA